MKRIQRGDDYVGIARVGRFRLETGLGSILESGKRESVRLRKQSLEGVGQDFRLRFADDRHSNY